MPRTLLFSLLLLAGGVTPALAQLSPPPPAPGTHRQTVCGLASRAGIGPPQFDENDNGIIGAFRSMR